MKRFTLEFDFTPMKREDIPEDLGWLTGRYWDYTEQDYVYGHQGGFNGNSMKTMKGYISWVKKRYAHQHPRNFRIFDREAPDEPCGHIGQVYFRAE